MKNSIAFLRFQIQMRRSRPILVLFIGLVVGTFVYLIITEHLYQSDTTVPNKIPRVSVSVRDFPEEKFCKPPKLNPFDPIMMDLMVNPIILNCTNENHPHLFDTDLDSNLIATPQHRKFSLRSCCYQDLYQLKNGIRPTKNCVPITQNVTRIPEDFEYIGIFCYNGTEENAKKNLTRDYKIVDIFGFARIKPEVEERIKKGPTFNENMSIIVLALDSVSHMNFIRLMPKTYAYLSFTLSATSMNGYNRVGPYTWENLLPLLSGHNVTELEARTNEWPNIWENFSARGFRTSYIEDGPWAGRLHYASHGFKKPSTDYYTPTMLHDPMQAISHMDKPTLLNYRFCCGPRPSLTSLLENIKKLASTMVTGGEIRKYFQIVWSNTLTHDFYEYTVIADDLILSTLMFLNKNGYLNHTVLALMSDHGHVWSPIGLTHQGKIENNMPFLYFAFPAWFKQKYRNAISNINLNQERLTTPFDLHETLLDLISPEKSISDALINTRQVELDKHASKPRGISLFLEIPKERTCHMAEIPKTYCVCYFSKPIPTNSATTKSAADSIVKELNHKLENYTQCAKLELSKIIGVEVREQQDSSTEITNSNLETLSITVEVSPSKGYFEAIVTRKSENDSWDVDEIIRSNMYGNQSHCITNFRLKPYCYC